MSGEHLLLAHVCHALGWGQGSWPRRGVSYKGPHRMLGKAEGTWKSLTWILCEGGIKAKISTEEGLGWE